MSTHSLRRCCAIGCVAVAVVALSCGQTVQPTEPTWMPPPGQTLSPLVGYWYARCRIQPVEIFVDALGTRAFGEGHEHASSVMRFTQVGDTAFRLDVWAGWFPSPTPEPKFSISGTESNFTFHPGETYTLSDGSRKTVIDGHGSLLDERLTAEWRSRVVVWIPPSNRQIAYDVTFLWQCTAVRALDL